MNNLLKKIFLSLTALSLPICFCACSNSVSDKPEKSADIGFADFQNLDKLSFDKRFATLENNILKVDTTSSKELYQPVISSHALENGKYYTISFKYKIDSPDVSKKYFHVLVRTGANSDILWENEGEATDFKECVYKIKIPENAKKYTFQIHTRGGVKGELKDLKIVQGLGESFYKFGKKAGKFTCKDNRPTGAKEFDIDLPNIENQKIVRAADFGVLPSARDFAKNLNRAIAHCRAIGASKLILEKGVYHINEEGTAIFDNLKDFEFDGNGSTLVYRKSASGNFTISNCVRVRFKNFKFDWDWQNDPIASLVEVVKIERNGDSYIDFKFLDYADFPNKNARITILTSYDFKNKNVNVKDAFTRVIEMTKGKGNYTRRQWVAPNIMRQYYTKNDLAPFKIGQHYLLAHYYYDMAGIFMRSNSHLTLEDIDIYSCAGHALCVAGTQKYWQFKNVNIGIGNGEKNRYMSCSGDHCHIAYSCGFFKMLNCDFSAGNDDCLNVHDCSIYARPTMENQNVLRTVSSRNVSEFYIGDQIELRNEDYSPTGYCSKIVSIKKSAQIPSCFDIAFAETLPEPKGNGFVLFDKRYDSRNVIIRDCNFHDTKARALLLLARDVSVERCNFWNLAGIAIKIETGYTYSSWSEGYGADNIVVRDCSFKDIAVRTAGGRTSKEILVSNYCKTDPSREKTSYPILSNILFQRNSFANPKGAIAQVHSCGNFIFENNQISFDDSYKANSDGSAIFVLADCQNIKIINNKINGGKNIENSGVYAEEKSTADIVVGGNAIEK